MEKGTIITGVPGINKIVVNDNQVEITWVADESMNGRWIPESIRELRDALTETLRLATGDSSSSVSEWRSGDFEPDGLDLVVDKDGDRWTRRSTGYWGYGTSSDYDWDYMLNNFGPVRRA